MKYRRIIDIIEKPISGEWGQNPENKNIGTKVIRSTNFTQEGRLDLEKGIAIRDIKGSKIQQKKLLPGDTIIEKSGGSPNQPVGRVVYFDVTDDTFLCNNFTSILRPKSDVDKRYFFWSLFNLHQRSVTLSFQNKTTGIINLQLKRYLEKAQIPLPPLPEQRRLAARLDKADAVRQKSRAVVEAYGELGRSVFLEMFGDPVRNERGWEVVELKKLADWKSGGTPSRSNKDFFNGDIPWYSSGELEEMYVGKSKENISEHALQNSAAKLIQPGSLLLGMYDTAALKSSITTAPSTCNQAIAFGKINEKIAEALYVYFAIQIGKSFYKRRQRGVRQKNMNLSMIKSLQIPLPPLDLQTRFARMVANIEAQRRLAERQLEAAEAVFGGVLQGTFG